MRKRRQAFLVWCLQNWFCALFGRGLSSHLVQGFSQPPLETDLVLELASSLPPVTELAFWLARLCEHHACPHTSAYLLWLGTSPSSQRFKLPSALFRVAFLWEYSLRSQGAGVCLPSRLASFPGVGQDERGEGKSSGKSWLSELPDHEQR